MRYANRATSWEDVVEECNNHPKECVSVPDLLMALFASSGNSSGGSFVAVIGGGPESPKVTSEDVALLIKDKTSREVKKSDSHYIFNARSPN